MRICAHHASRFTRPARVWTTHVSLESHDGVTSPNVPKRNAWNQPIKGIDDGTSRNLNSSLSTQQLEPTSQHKFTDALEWTSHVPTVDVVSTRPPPTKVEAVAALVSGPQGPRAHADPGLMHAHAAPSATPQ